MKLLIEKMHNQISVTILTYMQFDGIVETMIQFFDLMHEANILKNNFYFPPECFYNGTISNDVQPKQEYILYLRSIEDEDDE